MQIQIDRIRKLLVLAKRIESHETALLRHRAFIARFAIVIVLRGTQWKYLSVLKRYLRDMIHLQSKANEAQTAMSIFEILDVSKAY